MNIKIKSGSIEDFFESAKETAKKIDEGKRISPKNVIWVDPEDMIGLLKPGRTKLVNYLRGKNRIIFSNLISEMNRSPKTLNRDLSLLSKYHLVRVYKESIPGHGISKVIQPLFGSNKIEFKIEI